MKIVQWLKSHSSAIVGTLVAVSPFFPYGSTGQTVFSFLRAAIEGLVANNN